jgi:hypothetical protein
MNCPKCGTENLDKANFCRKCGSSLKINITETEGDLDSTNSPIPNKEYIPDRKPFLDFRNDDNTITDNNNSLAKIKLKIRGLSKIFVNEQNLQWGPFVKYGMPFQRMSLWASSESPVDETSSKGIFDRIKSIDDHSIQIDYSEIPTTINRDTESHLLCQWESYSSVINIYGKGSNIFASTCTFIRTPLSYIRISVAFLFLINWLYMVFFFPIQTASSFWPILTNLSQKSTGQSNIGFFVLLFVIGPAGIIGNSIFSALLLFSIYQWHKYRDLWAIFRMKPAESQINDLNIFQFRLLQLIKIALLDTGIPSENIHFILPSEKQFLRFL